MDPVLLEALKSLSAYVTSTSKIFAVRTVELARDACESGDVQRMLLVRADTMVAREVMDVLHSFQATIDDATQLAQEGA